jgi:hypothetical protein
MCSAASNAGIMTDTSALSKFLYLSRPCCPGVSGRYPLNSISFWKFTANIYKSSSK